jgi:hypothetical protein
VFLIFISSFDKPSLPDLCAISVLCNICLIKVKIFTIYFLANLILTWFFLVWGICMYLLSVFFSLLFSLLSGLHYRLMCHYSIPLPHLSLLFPLFFIISSVFLSVAHHRFSNLNA